MEKSHVKILNSNPVKAENRLKTETEKIQALMKKYENDEDPNIKFEQALRTMRNKTEDPVRLWIIGNALDNLDFPAYALEFKVKADELGYAVTVDEAATTEQQFDLNIGAQFTNKEDLEKFSEEVQALLNTFTLKGFTMNSNASSTTTNEAAGMTIKFTKSDYDKLKADNDFYGTKDGDKYTIKMDKDDINAGVWNPEDEELTVKHSALKKWLKENSFIKEGQEFIYNEKDLQPWSMFQQTSEEERAKPEYTTTAVLKMAQDVPILRFAYSQLASGDNDKDAKMIYNTYIKSDDDLMDKLKTYESYVMSIYEFVNNSPYADTVYDTVKAYHVEPADEDTQKLLSLVINKMTRALTKQIEYERSVFALYTPDVKQALYDTFKNMDVIDIVEQFKNAGFDIDNVDALNFDAENVLNLPDAAKNLVRDTIKGVDYTDALYLEDNLATIVYTTMIAIVLKEMVGLSITKQEPAL